MDVKKTYKSGCFEGCVLVYGHFSTIHAGHIRYLRYAKGQGDQLVAAVVGDTKNGSSSIWPFSQKERIDALLLLGLVDGIILMSEDELDEVVKVAKPSVLVLGNEHKDDEGLSSVISMVEGSGARVDFHAGEITYASTELLTSSESLLKRERREQFKKACSRQNIDAKSLIASMKSWGKSKLLIVGDTVVDQYAACEALGMSAEAPVVVVRELAKRSFVGAAAVVAAHIRSLGVKCDLVTVVGADGNASLVKEALIERGIGDGVIVDPNRPTTFKKRYVVENQKLFRVSRLEQMKVGGDVEEQIIEKIKECASEANGIVVSDFVYGVVTPRILEEIKRIAEAKGLLLFGDVQCSSQMGSILKFGGYNLLCPNERELRLALQDNETGIEKLSQELFSQTGSQNLIVKLAADGFIAYEKSVEGKVISQPYPALCVNPVDVAGAGDSVLAVMACGLSSGQSLMETAAITCCMASLAVEEMGNKPISSAKLEERILESLEQ